MHDNITFVQLAKQLQTEQLKGRRGRNSKRTVGSTPASTTSEGVGGIGTGWSSVGDCWKGNNQRNRDGRGAFL